MTFPRSIPDPVVARWDSRRRDWDWLPFALIGAWQGFSSLSAGRVPTITSICRAQPAAVAALGLAFLLHRSDRWPAR